MNARNRRLGLLGPAVLVAACAPATASRFAPAPGQPRYVDPATIVVTTADSGPRPLHTPESPDYPMVARPRGESALLIVAAVLDSTGRVELPTIAFLNAAAPEFREAVCTFLQHAQYSPFRVDGVPRRILVVTRFTFALDRNAWVSGVPEGEEASRALERLPPAQRLGYIEGKAHCQ